MSIHKLPRIETVNDRIRNSETFPRIRDAENSMKEFSSQWRLLKQYRANNTSKYAQRELPLIPKSEFSPPRISLDCEDPKQEYFNTFTLNTDKKCAKYMPFNKIHFPKTFGFEDMPPESLDKLWVAGFLDRAQRDADAVKRMQLRFLHEDVDDSTASMIVNDGSVTGKPGKNIDPLFDDSSIRSNVSDHLRFHQSKFGSLTAGVDELESETYSHISRSSSSIDDASINSNASNLLHVINDDPQKRLEKLLATRKERKSKTRTVPKLKPYQDSLKKKSSVSLSKKALPIINSLSSIELEKIFDTEKMENEAARKIQVAFRRSRVLLPWRRAVKCVLMAVRIQKLVRGFVTRKRVGRYAFFLNAIAIFFQARIRRYLSNKVVRPRLKFERQCAIKIQRIIRGKLGRIKWIRKRRELAVIRIQAMWRGVSQRVLVDRLWLDRAVVPIQRQGRILLAKKRLKLIKKELYEVAIKIQSKYRAYLARKRLGARIYQREMDYRLDRIMILTSEEEFVQDKIEKSVRRFLRTELKKKVEMRVDEFNNKLEKIHVHQNYLIEIQRQKEILSPRAIQQGWYHDLEESSVKYREELSNLKADCLFNEVDEVSRMNEHLQVKLDEIEEMAQWRDRLARAREMEYFERKVRFYFHDLREARKAKRQAIADEKRKWRVLFYHPDGKPDKRRRPGKPWDPSVFAPPEKMTYTGGAGVDLLLHDRPPQVMKPGSEESVSHTIGAMALQTYLEQVNHYEQLLNPIQKILRSGMRPVPSSSMDDEDNQSVMSSSTMGHTNSHAVSLAYPRRRVRPPISDNGIGTFMAPVLSQAYGQVEAIGQGWSIASSPPPLPLSSVRDGSITQLKRLEDNDNDYDNDNDSIASSISDISDIQHQLQVTKYDYSKMVDRMKSGYGKLNKAERLRMEQEAIEAERIAEEKRKIEENIRNRKERAEARRLRKKAKWRPAAIPWNLLDELDGEKKRYENERTYMEFNHKF